MDAVNICVGPLDKLLVFITFVKMMICLLAVTLRMPANIDWRMRSNVVFPAEIELALEKHITEVGGKGKRK